MSNNPKILIIEDNQDLNDMFKIAFEAEGFDVEIALEGLTGVTKAVEFKPDVILLDIMMPQMDGFETLEAIRKNTSLDTVIIINSNLEDDKKVLQAKQMGALDYLKKAEYTPMETVDKVKGFLEMTQKQRSELLQQYAIESKTRKKILIIEDNADLSELFKVAFDSEGFDVKVCTDGITGITTAVEFSPDVILLDIMMPQMDGFEVLSALRTNTSLKSLVVVHTASDDAESVARAKELGAVAYLKKSDYKPQEIVEKVKGLLS